MDIHTFEQSLTADAPPRGLPPALVALWHDARGHWASAHTLVQGDPSRASAWVHAYLHRKEGDHTNASYWYARAGLTMSHESLEAEWRDIARSLLADPEGDSPPPGATG